MTRDELAAIKAEWERVTAADPTTASEFWPTMQAVAALLAEVERLRALVDTVANLKAFEVRLDGYEDVRLPATIVREVIEAFDALSEADA